MFNFINLYFQAFASTYLFFSLHILYQNLITFVSPPDPVFWVALLGSLFLNVYIRTFLHLQKSSLTLSFSSKPPFSLRIA